MLFSITAKFAILYPYPKYLTRTTPFAPPEPVFAPPEPPAQYVTAVPEIELDTPGPLVEPDAAPPAPPPPAPPDACAELPPLYPSTGE